MAGTINHGALMDSIQKSLEPKNNPAKWTYERVAKMINDFEENLDADQEIGLFLVGTPTSVMHVMDVKYWGPDLMIFEGVDSNSKPMKFVQHHSQLSLLLTAASKVEEKARRIGFHLMSRLRD